MALTDEVTFFAKAGRGGDGVVRWRREKFKPKGGPAGGDGGKGGDFYVKGIRDITVLRRIAQKDTYAAQDGEAGKKNSMHGKNGEDFILELPLGSVITNTETGKTIEIVHDNEETLLLQGGEGGLGNEHFKSSTNQQPMEATKGQFGEKGDFQVELKLIADVGLVGLPNAGKTSLLNALTNAGARVGEYPFTTIDPNLGVYFKYIIADIPGLIEGASVGKGLGHKFLRHIARTKIVLHCISLERDTIESDFITIQNEIHEYKGISDKKQYIVLTKNDTVDAEKIKQAREIIKNCTNHEILADISILDDESVKNFGDSLVRILEM